jgi:hypothetical protein
MLQLRDGGPCCASHSHAVAASFASATASVWDDRPGGEGGLDHKPVCQSFAQALVSIECMLQVRARRDARAWEPQDKSDPGKYRSDGRKSPAEPPLRWLEAGIIGSALGCHARGR